MWPVSSYLPRRRSPLLGRRPVFIGREPAQRASFAGPAQAPALKPPARTVPVGRRKGSRIRDAGDRVERRHALQPNSPPRVLESWISHNEQHVVTQILAEPRGGLTAIGLTSCLTGVTVRAVKILVVPAAGLIPGFACEVSGTLASTPTRVPGARGLSSHPRSAPGDGDPGLLRQKRQPPPVTRPAAAPRTCGTCSPSRPVPPGQRPARRRPGNEAGRAPHHADRHHAARGASSATPRR
jgi:hypothetical protein